MRLRKSTIATLTVACGFLFFLVYLIIRMLYENWELQVVRELTGAPFFSNRYIFLFTAVTAIIMAAVIYLLRKLYFLQLDREDESNETEHQ
jgi:hypothetical protein